MKHDSALRQLILLISILVTLSPVTVNAQSGAFDVIPLGVRGGADESNLSSYALAAHGSNAFVCLDAGTIHSGVVRAVALNTLKGTPGEIIRNNIKGYLISHPHLDHVAGLIINSPDDSAKPIYGTSACLDVIRDKYFSWSSWANFGNEGETPQLKKYTYVRLTPAAEVPLAGTDMHVAAYVLSHASPQVSTAFLIRSHDAYALYLGDTGDDEIEKSDRLAQLWKAISPLIQTKKLKAIFIEVSYPNAQPVTSLFGHLTPSLLMKQMKTLSNIANNDLKDVNIVITHMKPGDQKEETIKKELQSLNTMDLKLVFPEQGKRIEL